MYIPVPMLDEHEAMSGTVKQLLERHVDVADVRSVLDIDRQSLGESDVWQRASAVGLPGIAIPDEFGGMGGSSLDIFTVFRDWGRVVHPTPLLSSIGMAAPTLVHAASTTAKEEYLPSMAEGTMLATLALSEDPRRWNPEDIQTTAMKAADGTYRLSGRKQFVLEVPSADVVLVVAQAAFGLGLFAVRPDAEGLRQEPLTSFDLSRVVCHLELAEVEGQLLSDEADISTALAHALRTSTLCLIADSVGGAEAALEMAVEYAKIREQFGRPIGSFQAVKHKLAELAVTVEGMVSVGWNAAEVLDGGDGGALAVDVDLLTAKVVCGAGYFNVARSNIQVHGGIGFTWEHPAHLYFRRAMANSKLLGDSAHDRDDLYRQLVARVNSAVPTSGTR